ncbi:hypothetical protein FZEAL_8443 [Fusarium zealandicum]|uniref:Zn(2)-C6 fungal-type domain-containing protein n=1 Tax=Fusarium zealandicum TaxID=1053134 RepID=A0A8H4XHV0_9HYPO|nr:hypothetical protein FZEAL_8443 [Fusarium zealandicum]
MEDSDGQILPNPLSTLISEEETSSTNSQTRPTSSCAECRRRRIKCEGLTTPCRQCIYYQVAHLCRYPPRKPRRSVSQRSLAEVFEAHRKAQTVLEVVFPSCTTDELLLMSREELIAKAQSLPRSVLSTGDVAEGIDDDLQILEPSPECDFTWDEVSDNESQISRIADDVNGLAFSADSLRESYLGLSSVPTILRVITHLSPQTRKLVLPSPPTWSAPTESGTTAENMALGETDEVLLINAYFYHVHPITPMVDEADFRQRYAKGNVKDSLSGSWLALLNTVLAMGCLASDATHFNGHNVYYKRATQHIGISSFGSGHLYSVQALALYGGYLLHYLHKPNTASAVLGAAIRMAVAMGLHRVQMPQDHLVKPQQTARSTAISRIHTWWSVFCLDTWAATTLGRPNLGYWNPATVLTSPTSSIASTDHGSISLAASEQFCKIATRIQGRLVQLPLISESEVLAFDRELLEWQSSVHIFFASRRQCPPNLRIARGLIWSRFMTTRLTLYRPALLNAALRQKSKGEASASKPALICKCIEAAQDTVDALALDWFPNQLLSWNSAWHLFQATLVLILAFILDRQWARQQRCGDCIGRALQLFAQVEHSSPGGTRSRELLEALYRAVDGIDYVDTGTRPDETNTSALDWLDMDLLGDDDDWVAFFLRANEGA